MHKSCVLLLFSSAISITLFTDNPGITSEDDPFVGVAVVFPTPAQHPSWHGALNGAGGGGTLSSSPGLAGGGGGTIPSRLILFNLFLA